MQFKRVVKQEGDNYKGRLKAIYEADDLTVNFSRFGEDVKALDSFVPFLNPAVQGVDKTVRIFKDNPKSHFKGIYAVTIRLYWYGAGITEMMKWQKNITD